VNDNSGAHPFARLAVVPKKALSCCCRGGCANRLSTGPWHKGLYKIVDSGTFSKTSYENRSIHPCQQQRDVAEFQRRRQHASALERAAELCGRYHFWRTVAILEVSLDWAQLLQVQPVQVKGAKRRRVVYAPVNPCGRTSFPKVIISGKRTHSNTIPGERAGRIAETRV
jgi:hypothetical protein